MQWWMVMFMISMGIWKETKDGSRGSFFSKSNMIRWVSTRYTSPNCEIKAFVWKGKVWRTSRVDMVVGDCLRSSISLYLWASRAWGLCTFLRSGAQGIWEMTSTLGWCIIRGSPVDSWVDSKVVGKVSEDIPYWRLWVCKMISSSVVRRILWSMVLPGWDWPGWGKHSRCCG